jgi:hypothetical protein
MTTNHQWLDRATLIMEYRACVEHYTALVTVNLATARGQKPIELIETARLNCDAVRARLTEHKREHHNSTGGLSHRHSRRLRGGEPRTTATQWPHFRGETSNR